jgi:hypothetical protein
MKPIVKLALIAGMALMACLSARAQSPAGRLFYEGKGDYSIGGKQLSDGELCNLIGDNVYYNTYLSAQKQRKLGLPLGIVGASLLGATVAWYAIAIDAPWVHEKDVIISSGIVGGIGLVASAGFALYFIGNGRLKWIAEDYNSRNGYAMDLSFGPAPHGIGLTLNF